MGFPCPLTALCAITTTTLLSRWWLQVPIAFYIRPPTKLFDATSKEDFGSWAL